jgi:hypothetical protein
MEARQSTEVLLEKFTILRLKPELDDYKYLANENDTDIDNSLVIITREEADHIRDKFFKDADSAYKQALRDQETVKTTSHVPMYIIVLLIVLGFDEFLHVVTNPLLFLFVAFIGGSIYVIHILNMGGPVKKAVETLLQTSLSGVQGWLSQQLQQHNVPLANPNANQPNTEPNPNNKKRD